MTNCFVIDLIVTFKKCCDGVGDITEKVANITTSLHSTVAYLPLLCLITPAMIGRAREIIDTDTRLLTVYYLLTKVLECTAYFIQRALEDEGAIPLFPVFHGMLEVLQACDNEMVNVHQQQVKCTLVEREICLTVFSL